MIPSSFLPGRVFRRPFLFVALATVAFAAPADFDIPAKPAPAALDLFIKQSGAQVVYLLADVKDVQANPVKGAYEPAAALGLLLKDTGLSFTERKPGQFSVGRTAAITTGSVKGSLVGEGGRGLPDVLVSIRETAQSAPTDRYGVYVFPKVAAGTYVLVATAPGYQPMHITDVVVRAGRDLILGKEDMRKAQEGVLALEPFVVHADTVTELEKFEVTGTKSKPFTASNVDLPRTIDDVQPYYVFDSTTIERSGATNVEDLLKQQLTMNAVAETNAQASDRVGGVFGNTSTVNLRGLGTDKTLILVNGRRLPTISYGANDQQPDLNGIPLSAIERIEVLPSSASGIYGGSAIGGVVNIILKRNYTGGEIRATYDSAMDTDSPTRTVAVTYGLGFPDGKTHLMVSVQASDANPLRLQDRREVLDRNVARILANSPNFFVNSQNPWLGALPNIQASGTVPSLVLDDGTSLNSRTTFIAAGTSPTTSAAALAASLVANAGKWNMDLPTSTQQYTGLLQQLGTAAKIRSFTANLRRQMLASLELFADVAYLDNRSTLLNNPFTATQTVPVTAPNNPFQQAVLVRFPNATDLPLFTYSTTRSATVGAVVQLPRDWSGELDYTWSESRFGYSYFNPDGQGLAAALASGAVNPFVDTLLYPVDFSKYVATSASAFSSTLADFALRASGPLKALPWGKPELTTGLEHRTAETPPGLTDNAYPITTTADNRTYFYDRRQVTDSAYAETTIPLVKRGWLPALYALDLQLSGRSERYVVDAGTSSRVENYGLATPTVTYNGPTRNGLPYFEKARYSSNNFTVGGKYQPVPELTLRASRASAFLPPTPIQLAPVNTVSTTTTGITDPKTGTARAVTTVSGGNAGLTPQSSKSLNLGLIWAPRWRLLQGLRLDAEYYEIEQFNYIGTLSAQQIVNLESVYPDRVIRDASGNITTVDISYLNLYRRKTTGWDLSAGYTRKTAVGTFSLRAVESIIAELRTQYSLTLPEYEAVGFHPIEGGAPKYKSTVNLAWELRQWTLGWTSRYVSDYKVYGATDGPTALQLGSTVNNLLNAGTRLAQGSDHIPGQIYHDAFVSYAFGQKKSGPGSRLSTLGPKLLSGLTVQVGVRNLFDRVPPFDVKYDNNYYLSPYGDLRLRSYWVSLKKEF